MAGFFLPDVMSSYGGMSNFGSLPASMQSLNFNSGPTPWYNNAGLWSMVGKFGSAVSPKDSWQQRLGAAAADTNQATQYGNAMNKLVSSIRTQGTNPIVPASGLSTQQPTGDSSGLSGPPVDPANQNTQVAGVMSPSAGTTGTQFPFSDGSSVPVLSSAELMGLSADQIGKVMETAVLAKEFPMKIAEHNSNIAYKNAITAESLDRVAREKKAKESYDTMIALWKQGKDRPSFLGKGEDADGVIAALEGLGTHGIQIIDNLINLQKQTNGKYVLHEDNKGNLLVIDAAPGVSVGNRVVDRIPIGVKSNGYNDKPLAEKLNSWHVTQARGAALAEMNTEIMNDYYKSFGKNAADKQEWDSMMDIIRKDPMKADSYINSILGRVSPALYDKYNNRVNTISASLATTGTFPTRGTPGSVGDNGGGGAKSSKLRIPTEAQVKYTEDRIIAKNKGVIPDDIEQRKMEELKKSGFNVFDMSGKTKNTYGDIYALIYSSGGGQAAHKILTGMGYTDQQAKQFIYDFKRGGYAD